MRAFALLACGAALALPALAAGAQGEPSRAGDAVAGKAKSAPCAGCHGVGGISRNDLQPRLAGQSYAYLRKQLDDFASGARANDPVMASFARPLSTQDRADLAAYYSCLSPADGAEPEGGLAQCR